MAVIYNTTLKNTRMTAVVTAIDAGVSNGYLEIGTAGMASILATIPFTDPCGSVSGGVLTFSVPVSDTSADNTGTAAAAQVKDSNGTIVASGLTVGTAATNVVLNSVSISAGQIVTLTSATITHG